MRHRVLTIITGLSIGGAEFAALRLLQATKGNCEHMVVSLGAPGGALADEFRNAGIQVLEIGVTNPSMLWRMASLVTKLRAFKPDVVVAHMYHACVFATALKPFLRTPLMWVIHHSLDAPNKEGRSTRAAIAMCRKLSPRADTIVYVSPQSAEQHREAGFKGYSVIIRNPHDFERFRFDAAARSRLWDALGFTDEHTVFGLIARVHPMKDHQNFLEAFRIARARNPNLRAVLCGAGTQALQIHDNIRSYVRALGPRSDMPEIMSACDFGVLSSSFGESLPNVLIEFMACERPCVATSVGGSANIVSDYGMIVPPSDFVALAKAMVALSEMAPDERIKLGQDARSYVVSEFSPELVALHYEACWSDLKDGTHQALAA